jgi:hypothetical protein
VNKIQRDKTKNGEVLATKQNKDKQQSKIGVPKGESYKAHQRYRTEAK